MNAARRIARWLVAAVLVTFAATSFAGPTKQWSVAATPSTFSTASNVKVTLTVTNQTPNGNSNINSLQIALPVGYTVNTVSTSWVGQLSATNGVITLSNMSPLKPQSSLTITANLNVNIGTVGCAATTWPGAPQTMAWTGSSFSGDTFLLLKTPSTSVNPNSTLAFGSLPTGSVSAGTSITGTVSATSCGAPASGVPVTVTMGGQNSVVTTGANGQTGFTFSTSGLPAGTYPINASDLPGYPLISTNVTVCLNGLAFTVQPANVQTGNAVNATVQATSCSTGSVVQGVSITAQVKDSSGTTAVSPQPTISYTPTTGTDANGNVSISFTTSSLGTYTIGAGATNYTSTTSAKFKVFAGTLNCGDAFASSFVDPYYIAPDQPGYAAGMRNGYNKDGVSTTCVPVLYTFTNNILTSNQVQLSWDTSSQPNAAFEYTLNWQAQSVGTSGWPATPQPGIAWLNTDGSSTSNAANSASTPAFIPALACLSNKLPAPYGSLASDVQPADTTITVSGVAANPTVIIPGSSPATAYLVPTPGVPAVPATPFPIVIANTVNGVQSTATERVTAKSIASITPDPSTVNPPTAASYYTGTYTIVYNVTRGTAAEGYPGGYPGGANPSHAASTLVVSTPLPIIPNDSTTFPAPYAAQTQAQMCIADHGFQAFGAGSSGQVMYWTTVIDIGDGVVKGSF